MTMEPDSVVKEILEKRKQKAAQETEVEEEPTNVRRLRRAVKNLTVSNNGLAWRLAEVEKAMVNSLEIQNTLTKGLASLSRGVEEFKSSSGNVIGSDTQKIIVQLEGLLKPKKVKKSVVRDSKGKVKSILEEEVQE